jgi:hypothetical protein
LRDRLARTLDVLVPHLDALWQDLIVAAVRAFDALRRRESKVAAELRSIDPAG